ncbi:MAG: hypothetical protein COA51_04895 [Idiomarina sp.]|nr:MAG: hypothetical protein COA51_04895 [Idiomarina sp.]
MGNLDDFINLFESDDEWSLSLEESNVAKANSKSDEKKLIDDLFQAIEGDDFSKEEFFSTIKHYQILYHSSGERAGYNALVFLSIIKYLIDPSITRFTITKSRWLEAKAPLSEIYKRKYKSLLDCSYLLVDQYKEIALAAKRLGSGVYGYKYAFEIQASSINFSENEEKRICESIFYRLKRLGIHGFMMLIEDMKRFYDKQANRYYFRLGPNSWKNRQELVPWGYLYNLSLSALESGAFKRKPTKLDQIKYKKIYDQLIDLSVDYFLTQDLREVHQFEATFQTHQTILDLIRKTVIFDQQFTFDQLSGKHCLQLIDDLYIANYGSNQEISLFRQIAEWTLLKPKCGNVTFFSVDDVMRHLQPTEFLNPTALRSKLTGILNLLSHDVDNLNKDYLLPNALEARNAYRRPFIKINEGYLFPPSSISAIGFIHALEAIYGDLNTSLGSLGDNLEIFIKQQFKKSEVDVQHAKKYRFPQDLALELDSTRESGEIDLILESESKLILMEIKKKLLTGASRSGSVKDLVRDLALSLVFPIVQCGYHEYFLRRKGKIPLKNGGELRARGRDIEKIAVSFLDYKGLQDAIVTNSFLRSLINAKLTDEKGHELEEINKYLDQLRAQYSSDEFQRAYKIAENPNLFSNCFYYSVPQLLTVLDNSKGVDDFLKKLHRTRHITMSTRDWYLEWYYRMKSS